MEWMRASSPITRIMTSAWGNLAFVWLVLGSVACCLGQYPQQTPQLYSTDFGGPRGLQFSLLLQECRNTEAMTQRVATVLSTADWAEFASANRMWSRGTLSGWRWEANSTTGDEHWILAVDAGLIVAIRQTRTIEMSVIGLHADSSQPESVSAMSLQNLTNKNAQMAQIYYYFAGPTWEIPNSRALPPPPSFLNLGR